MKLWEHKTQEAFLWDGCSNNRGCQTLVGNVEFRYEVDLIPYLFDRSLEGWSVESVSESKYSFTVNLIKIIDRWDKNGPHYVMNTNIDADLIDALAHVCPAYDQYDPFARE